MDSLTQIVLGAAVGEAVLGKRAGNKAMFYGAIAGTIPDLDALAGLFTDTVTAIEVHRAFTHSIVFSLLSAPLFGWGISKIERKAGVGWKAWSKLMFWCLFTHPLLDSFTTWGTQLFWPLDYEVALKSIFVIDPLYTVPLLIFVVLAMRRKRQDPKRQKWNRMGLILSTSYLILSLMVKAVAFERFSDSLEKQGIFYSRMDVRPAPFNIVLWNANVEVGDAFLTGDYSLLDEDLIRFEAYPKNHHYLGHLKDARNVQRLIEISQGWFTLSSQKGQLYFNDLRFGKINPGDPNAPFTFSYRLVPTENGVRVEEVDKEPGDVKGVLHYLWTRIKGN